MALNFSATGDIISIGSPSASVLTALDGPGTVLLWVFPTSTPGATPGSFVRGGSFVFNPSSTLFQLSIARGTQSLLATATYANIPNYVNNTWCCIAVTYDPAGLSTQQQIWNGNLSTPLAEVTAYGVQRPGTGTVTADTRLDIGNDSISTTLKMLGRIAFVAIWNRRLTQAELWVQQFNPHVTSGCVYFSHIGYNGTGTQADLSGEQNNGTVTGTALAAHVPLGPPFGFDDNVYYNVSGTTYNDSITIGIQQGTANSVLATDIGSISIGIQQGTAESILATSAGSISIGAQLGTADSILAINNPSISLGPQMGTSDSILATDNASIALGPLIGLSDSLPTVYTDSWSTGLKTGVSFSVVQTTNQFQSEQAYDLRYWRAYLLDNPTPLYPNPAPPLILGTLESYADISYWRSYLGKV